MRDVHAEGIHPHPGPKGKKPEQLIQFWSVNVQWGKGVWRAVEILCPDTDILAFQEVKFDEEELRAFRVMMGRQGYNVYHQKGDVTTNRLTGAMVRSGGLLTVVRKTLRQQDEGGKSLVKAQILTTRIEKTVFMNCYCAPVNYGKINLAKMVGETMIEQDLDNFT